MVDSLLGGSVLNYVGHKACVRKKILVARRANMYVELGEVARRKDLAGVQEINRLHRVTRNGAWLRAVPHRIKARSCLRRNSEIIFASYMG